MAPILEHFRELYRHRALVHALVWRDVKARYRGSVLGYCWTLVNPLILLGVYTLVFTRFTQAVELPSYPVFVFVGLLPWLWVAGAVTTGAGSIVAGGSLITRVCIPPQVLPAVTVLSTLVNLLFALPIAIVACAAAGLLRGAPLAWLPFTIALQLVVLYAMALALSALTVRFRDVAFLVQSLLTVWFIATPVAYPVASVPSRYLPIVFVNPVAPVIVAFQDMLFFGRMPDPAHLAIAAGWAATLLLVGVAIFESLRDDFAEDL